MAVKYHQEIQAKNNAILKAHKNRIVTQNKSQDLNVDKTKTNPIESSPENDHSKPSKQIKQNNQIEKTVETLNIEQIKKEIMLQTTRFILNKLGKEHNTDTENIKKEIEDFLNGPKDIDKETEIQESMQSVTIENVTDTPKETPNTGTTRTQKSVRTELPKSVTKFLPKKNKTLGCTPRQLNFNNPNRLKAPKTPKSKTLSFRK